MTRPTDDELETAARKLEIMYPQHCIHAAAMLRACKGDGWEHIGTAPKNKIILVYRPSAPEWAQVAPAKWDTQEHYKKPNPFWAILLKIGGTYESRAWEPTHWRPMPDAPR